MTHPSSLIPHPSAYEHVLFEADGPVATITLNRPAQLNALNVRIGVELLDALRRCEGDPAVRCVVLTGAGLSVGTDTSPYLERFNERISWNGDPIPDDELERILGRRADLEPLLPDRPSYFEIVNAVALEWFAGSVFPRQFGDTSAEVAGSLPPGC